MPSLSQCSLNNDRIGLVQKTNPEIRPTKLISGYYDTSPHKVSKDHASDSDGDHIRMDSPDQTSIQL